MKKYWRDNKEWTALLYKWHVMGSYMGSYMKGRQFKVSFLPSLQTRDKNLGPVLAGCSAGCAHGTGFFSNYSRRRGSDWQVSEVEWWWAESQSLPGSCYCRKTTEGVSLLLCNWERLKHHDWYTIEELHNLRPTILPFHSLCFLFFFFTLPSPPPPLSLQCSNQTI